jgi:hypothetical protein
MKRLGFCGQQSLARLCGHAARRIGSACELLLLPFGFLRLCTPTARFPTNKLGERSPHLFLPRSLPPPWAC